MVDVEYAGPEVHLAAGLGVLAPSVAGAEPRLHRELRAGRWKRYVQVVVCHNGPLIPEQAVWVAVLRCPHGVVLSGLTAAIRRGLRWAAPVRPELLVPAAGPLPHLQGVDVARTRLLGAADVHPSAQPPQLRLPRALIDRARRVDRPDDVRALLCAGVQQRLVRASDLREVVLRLGPVRHRSGGRHHLDAVWNQYGLHAEIDGLGHLLVANWASDVDRTNELELSSLQECRLRIPGFWLDERPAHVVDQVRRGLLRGGWVPTGSSKVAITESA